MGSARDLVTDALKDIGVIAAGENPSASEASDGLKALNQIINTWSNDGFLIFEDKREELQISSGTQDYTIGSGGDFDTKRPQVITSAGYLEPNSTIEMPIRILTIDEWSRVRLKSMTSTMPQAIYYNPTYPLGTISVWPKPSASSKLVLYSKKPLSEFSSLDDNLSLPPGYENALQLNLSIKLARQFGKTPSLELKEEALEAKTLLQRVNTGPVLMRSDVEGLLQRRGFNWILGE